MVIPGIRSYFLVIICCFLLNSGFAQKITLPIDPSIAQNTSPELIKIGMVKKDVPPKVKFGPFSTDQRQGAGKDMNGDPLRYSFVVEQNGETAIVQAANKEDDRSIYISTSLDEEELWILLMAKTPGEENYSAEQLFLTNGEEELEIRTVIGDATGKYDNTSPRGVELYIEEQALGAMQYYSGGSFSYKKYIWIRNDIDPRMQLVTAAVFCTMLQESGNFEDVMVVE